jgi:hypothetical protein
VGKLHTLILAWDKRGWGMKGGAYTIKLGYQYQLQQLPLPPKEPHWNAIWKSEAIPKVKVSSWVLCHKRILTTENLKKHGVEGPSRCVLCKKREETLTHLFTECDFTQEVWRILLLGLVDPPLMPTNITKAYDAWHKRYSGSFTRKPLLKRVWAILPFYVNWKIWLARNKEIFSNEATQPQRVVSQAWGLMIETIELKGNLKQVISVLEAQERLWLSPILNNTSSRKHNADVSIGSSPWKCIINPG